MSSVPNAPAALTLTDTHADYPTEIFLPMDERSNDLRSISKDNCFDDNNRAQGQVSDSNSDTGNNTLYTWAGLNREGLLVTGTLYATTKLIAQATLIQQGIRLKHLQSIRAPSSIIYRCVSFCMQAWKNRNRLKRIDMLALSQQLALLLEAGLSLTQSLKILEQTSTKPKRKELLIGVRQALEEGVTFKDSLERYPKHFDRLYCGLIHMGERTGTLVEALKQIVSYQGAQETLKQHLKKSLSYPLTVLIIAFAITAALLVFVFPQFTAFFKTFNAELPWLTRGLLRFSQEFRHDGLYLCFLLITILYASRWTYKNNGHLRALSDKYIFGFPLLGSFLKKIITARFARTLSTTLNAGLPLLEAIEVAAGAIHNHYYNRAIKTLGDRIADGQSLEQAIKATQVFSPTVDQMIAVGEESGKLCEMLAHIANYYETEIQQRILTFNTLFEPTIMILLGILIGSLIFALYLPIFKLSSLF